MTHLEDATTADLAAANVANFSRFLALQRGLDGAEVRHDEAVTWVANADPMFWFNMVSRLRLAEDDVGPFIDALKATHGRLGTDVMVWLSPLETPADLGDRLEAEGLRPIGHTPAMAADLHRITSPEVSREVSIERVGDPDTLATYVATLGASYGMGDGIGIWGRFCDHVGQGPEDPVQHYLGRLEGRPVCCVTLYLADGVAGIYAVGTVPEARRRGVASMVTAAALAEARERGYRYGILQSSAMAASLYRAMGFEDTFAYRTYGWSPKG